MTMPLADLTLPTQPNAATLRRVLVAVARVHAEALLKTAQQHDPGLARQLQALEQIGALRPLLLRPQISVLARVWLAVVDLRPTLRDRLSAALAVEAALVGRLPEPVTIAPNVAVGVPRLGLRIAAEPEPQVVTPQWIEDLAQRSDGPRDYLPIHAAVPNARFAVVDDNPLPIFYDHPKRRGNVVSLGEQPLDTWRDQLTFAIDHLAAHLPNLLAEMQLFLGHVIPVGFLP